MKIDLEKDIDHDQFLMKGLMVDGAMRFLVTPQGIATKWNKTNSIFRSSMWDKDGNLISAGLKKFYNWNEHPELVREPKRLNGCSIMEKVDGSSLIISPYKGKIICRTRGVFSVEGQDTELSVDILKERYPKVFNDPRLLEGYSYVYEMVSPIQRVIIDYGEEPDLYLTNVILHDDYSYLTQQEVTSIAIELDVKRPRQFFNDSTASLLNVIKRLVGTEGVCVYFNNEQDIKKLKSDWYLALHRFKENGSDENVLDLFISCGMPEYSEFVKTLEDSLDFECCELAKPFASKVCDAYKEVLQIQEHMTKFVAQLGTIKHKDGFKAIRGLQAQEIHKAYGATNRANFASHLLDGEGFSNEATKKLLFQVLYK